VDRPLYSDGGLLGSAGTVIPVSSRPTLHLTVGLPGVGKTTLARELEQAGDALRLTPDEWMAPLFGLRWADLGDKRDVLEGRLIWVGHQVVRAGVSVILDFGCWSPEERYALRAIADLAVADFKLHYLSLPEHERRQRADARWHASPQETFALTLEDHERFHALFSPPTPMNSNAAPHPRLRSRSRAGPPGLLTAGPRSHAWTSERQPAALPAAIPDR
jgi:predicted kinase